jgi:hypothetical protein
MYPEADQATEALVNYTGEDMKPQKENAAQKATEAGTHADGTV